MTNPAGSAIVNATGPIRQIVNDPANPSGAIWSLPPAMRRSSERQFRCKPSDGRLRQAAGGAHHEDMLLQVEPLIPALRRYARALVRNRATADDLVQDCLERAVSRWHQRATAMSAPGCSPSSITSRSISFANGRARQARRDR